MKILISTLLMFIASISVAQRNLSDKIKSKVNNKEFFSKYSFFQSEKVLNNQKLGGNYTEFILDDIQLNKFLKDQPLQFELTITGLSQNYSLKLIRSNIIDVSTIFNVIDKDGNSAEFKYMAPLFYQGVIGDVQQNSFVTASISKTGGIRIFISVNHQNIKVSKIKDNADTNVYGCFEHLPGNNEAFNFECGTRGENFNINNQQLDTAPLSTLSYGSKVIRCFFDCAFTYYQQNGSSVQNTIDRITDLFNQSALCYANESVNISISQITVYTSPDPFNHANRNVGLSSFKNTVQNAWVGNVAMLCDWTASINSGLADGIGVLCNNFPAAAGHYIYNDL